MEKEKLRSCIERLQTVKIQATIENMEAMLQTMYDLRDEYQKEVQADAADPE